MMVHEVFPELVGTRAISESVADALGVSSDESVSIIQTMCSAGLSVGEAGASYNRILTLIVRPSESFATWMDERVGETPESFVMAHGLTRLLTQLAHLGPGDLLRVLGDIRATRGVLAMESPCVEVDPGSSPGMPLRCPAKRAGDGTGSWTCRLFSGHSAGHKFYTNPDPGSVTA